MKKILIIISILLMNWNAPIYNWGSGWCSTCYLQMNTDIPNDSTGWTGYIAGWAFVQFNGEPAQIAYVYVDGIWKSDIEFINGLYRPDVEPYSGRNDDGWAIYFDTPIPSGTHTISVVLWNLQLSTTQTGSIIVP